MNYRREIDGLRAVAVLPVIFFHAGFEVFSGGFVGVDVFFVISGYLITSIILLERDAGSFSLVSFYERRARRILPALFFVMAVSIPFSWYWMSLKDLESFTKSVVSVVFFVSNFFFWRDGGYFETANEIKPLLHTWSLAIEEQYYLLFPLLVLIMWRFGKRPIIGFLCLISLVSLGLAQWGAYSRPVPTYLFLSTRGWELAIGALAAFFLHRKQSLIFGNGVRQILSALGLFLIFLAVFFYSRATPFPSVYALVPTIGTVLVILFASPSTLAGRLLGGDLLVGIGAVSYSAYLWHQPLFAFTRIRSFDVGIGNSLALILLVFALSFLSWGLVEKPFRDRSRFSRKHIFIFSGIGGAIFSAYGLAVVFVLNSHDAAKFEASRVATELTRYPAVFSSNVDERQFIISRIQQEINNKPRILILGSSRVMQIGEKVLGKSALNLSVSGASIEDNIAIIGAAETKFMPEQLIVAADPWLFNSESGQNRWQSIEKEYWEGLSRYSNLDYNLERSSNIFQGIYDDSLLPALSSSILNFWGKLNTVAVGTEDDSPSPFMSKIRRDGTRVYDLKYASKSEAEKASGFDGLLNYAMMPYRFSPHLKGEIIKFLNYVAGKYHITLVLSPYHPGLYDRMQVERPVYLEIENEFRKLAKENEIRIVGSYNPRLVGCTASEFYDGMHPRDSCMAKVVNMGAR